MNYLVSDIIAHGSAVKEFRFRTNDGAPLEPWDAGSHLQLSLPQTGGLTLERHYSLVGAPGTVDEYRIAVLHDAASKGGSAYMHTAVAVGDTLEIAGPFNSFPIIPRPGRTVLIAGGIGVTPLLSMAHRLAQDQKAFELHYLARSDDRLALWEELNTIPNGSFTAYTPERGNAKPDLKGILGAYAEGTVLYACGPNALLQGIRTAATALAWPEGALHFESFGARTTPSDAPLSVYLAQSDITLNVQPGTTVLDALLAADLFVSYECKRGECANCFTPVLEGVPIHRDVCLTERQRQIGMCTCVSWAAGGRLVLDM